MKIYISNKGIYTILLMSADLLNFLCFKMEGLIFLSTDQLFDSPGYFVFDIFKRGHLLITDFMLVY